MRSNTIRLNAAKAFRKLIFAFALCALASDFYAFEISPDWDLTVPHINRGVLTEVKSGELTLLLDCDEDGLARIEPEYLPYDTGLLLKTDPDGKNYYRQLFTRLEAVYRQTFKETPLVLYRVMIEVESADKSYWTDMEEPFMYQKIYVFDSARDKINLLFADFYYTTMIPNTGKKTIYDYKKITNLMPIIQKGNMTGILIYNVASFSRVFGAKVDEEFFGTDQEEKTLHSAALFRFKNPLDADLRYWQPVEKNEAETVVKNGVVYEKTGLESLYYIEGVDPLFDKKQPFRYTIQNAFDQNPATSYVEDTEGDYISIKINGYTLKVQKIRFINGYAANRQLYDDNNKIKNLMIFCDMGTTLTTGGKKYTFKGKETENFFLSYPPSDPLSALFYWQLNDSLDYQILESKNLPFECYPYISRDNKIEKGLKYTDTCIAEIDYYLPNTGWLFGD